MHRHKFLRHAAAVLAAAALLTAVVLAGLAAALPDTLYTDGPAAELEIASITQVFTRPLFSSNFILLFLP